jgi:Zn finger protein HypA/HybF involved in hydrogenase expression
MHEVSLVAALIAECERRAASQPVRLVRVRHASSIPEPALKQAFRMLTEGGNLANALLEAEKFEVLMRCGCGFALWPGCGFDSAEQAVELYRAAYPHEAQDPHLVGYVRGLAGYAVWLDRLRDRRREHVENQHSLSARADVTTDGLMHAYARIGRRSIFKSRGAADACGRPRTAHARR